MTANVYYPTTKQMPNPNPNQSGLTNFQPQGELIEPLAAKPINTKHYHSVDAVLRGRGDRQALIRRYVLEGLQRDGLLPSDRP